MKARLGQAKPQWAWGSASLPFGVSDTRCPVHPGQWGRGWGGNGGVTLSLHPSCVLTDQPLSPTQDSLGKSWETQDPACCGSDTL